MFKYEGVVWGFILLGIVYVFVNSEMGKSLFLKFSKSGVELTISKETPPKKVPSSLVEKKQSKQNVEQKLTPPKVDSILKNVAKGKPVIYIPKKIITSRGEWDRDMYYEKYSANMGNYPSNLTDGNPATVAYPASWFFDYIIDLEELHAISKINLVWKNYGERKEEIYITSWKLLAQKEMPDNKVLDDNDWRIIDSRDHLDEKVTSLDFDPPILASRFRIYAESIDRKKQTLFNWIGIYEFEALTKKSE